MSRRIRLAREVCLGLALLATAGCGGSSSSVSAASSTPLDFDFGTNDPNRVTAFGDSITQGAVELRRRDFGLITSYNYPSLLQNRVRSLGPAWRVINRGVGSERTTQGARRLPSALRIDRPGFVLILEGTNDAKDCGDAAVVTSNLRNMVSTVKANKSIPIIGTIPPRFRKVACSDEVITEVNANIHAFARAEQVVVAEIFDGMNDRALFGLTPESDPLHPNDQGYAVMADIWFQAILKACPGGVTTALRGRR